MRAVRQLLRHRPGVAWALVALTLAMKLLVPVGFMPSFADQRVTIVLCTGMGAAKMTMAIPGMDHSESDPGSAEPEKPCLGAGLGAALTGGADPVQLALAFALAITAGLLLAIGPPRPSAPHLRPPLRGPPLTA